MVPIDLLAGQEQRRRHRGQICGRQREKERVGWIESMGVT